MSGRARRVPVAPGWSALLPRRVSARTIRLFDTAPPVATSKALAHLGGAFYVSGGLVCLWLAGTEADLRHPRGIAAVGLLALLAGVCVASFAERIRLPARIVMNLLGTALVLAAVLLAGRTVGGEALFWLFCYVPIDSFFFFPWRWAIPLLGWGIGASAIAVFGAEVITPQEWVVMTIVDAVIAAAIGWLIRGAADAEWDSATGMLSRKGLDREMADRCEDTARTGRTFSVATVSLNGVDRVTLSRGGRTADMVVREVALAVRRVPAKGALWARLRDTELAVLWGDGAGFEDYLAQVCAAADPVTRLSIGVADCSPGATPHEVLAAAMVGRKFAERHGGGVHRSGIVARTVAELRQALDSDQLVVHYQPIVDLGSGRIRGAEALVRWEHPERGLIQPAEFISLAEDAGLIGVLGGFVLQRACADAARWCRPEGASADPTVSVNVSGLQLETPGFGDAVVSVLRDTGLPADRLLLEVTESTAEGGGRNAHQALIALRAVGVRIAIDDFGTGYSNLARLALLPIDVLKVDRSFVVGATDDERAQEMLKALIGFAHHLGLATVVEGIEDREHAELVAGLGAHAGQGWYWGRAMPNSAFPLTSTARRRLSRGRVRPGELIAAPIIRSATGHGADDQERLPAGRDRVGQRLIGRGVRQVLFAGEEAHERTAHTRCWGPGSCPAAQGSAARSRRAPPAASRPPLPAAHARSGRAGAGGPAGSRESPARSWQRLDLDREDRREVAHDRCPAVAGVRRRVHLPTGGAEVDAAVG